MADEEQLISSTTPLFPEGHHYQAEPDPEPDLELKQNLFSADDIVDLVGGAQDALERHIAEDSVLQEFSLTSTEPEPEPEVREPEPEPAPEPVVERAVPDSTSFSFVPEKPEVVAPKAEPESTRILPEPQAEPAPESDALLAAVARKASPAPAEASDQPTVTQEPAAPASYVPSPSKAQPCPLMQFPTELGQKGDSPAPISPISPLHSPDSLEELSLTESPNQLPTGSAASLGSFSVEPSSALSKDMPWKGEHVHSKNKEDHLDSLAGPYLSLGKDTGPYNPCEDSGVSFSPEEKLVNSDRSSTGPSPVNPHMMVPESHLASSNPTEPWDLPFLSSQDNSKPPMDSFTKDTTTISPSKYEPDVCVNHSDEDDDLMYEVKRNNNPFEGYSPLADSGYSHFGEPKSETQASKMSDSPTPDLVQYGQSGGSQENLPSILDEGKTFETSKVFNESPMQSLNQFSSGPKNDDGEEEEDSTLPPSLPDILKSSPLNPEKMDSGSSEGSPEEQSPILERRMMESPNPPINLSANNPFAFDTKVSLLKEMAEEMEARATDKPNVDDKSFGAFDLVKEAEESTPAKVKEEAVKIEQKDWFSSQDSPKNIEKFEPLDLQSKKNIVEDSDSESPTADSLSPVLEAMAKNPASFQVETDQKDLKMELEEPEVGEEVSEHEVSSEEFEFIERPPKGVIDEFLEALDPSKFASSKPPEIPMDDDLSFSLKDSGLAAAAPPKVASPLESKEDTPSQSSYRLLTQASPQKTKAELEKLDIQQHVTQAPLTRSPVGNPEEPVAKKISQGGRFFRIPNLNIRADVAVRVITTPEGRPLVVGVSDDA